ncbi:MAG: aldo/keto reductase [Streptosporangiales bacterium]|nr:aldo/keto reductase [Streptosporangiales bacterium]
MTGQTASNTVADAIAAGYRHVDTAVAYGNHEQVGDGIGRGGVDRDDLWITTKIWLADYAPEKLRASAEQSLKDLGVDHVDLLLLLHWPPADDVETEPALHALKADGLIRELGVSNFPDHLLRPALQIAPELFADQVEYHAHLAQEKLTATALEVDQPGPQAGEPRRPRGRPHRRRGTSDARRRRRGRNSHGRRRPGRDLPRGDTTRLRVAVRHLPQDRAVPGVFRPQHPGAPSAAPLRPHGKTSGLQRGEAIAWH